MNREPRTKPIPCPRSGECYDPECSIKVCREEEAARLARVTADLRTQHALKAQEIRKQRAKEAAEFRKWREEQDREDELKFEAELREIEAQNRAEYNEYLAKQGLGPLGEGEEVPPRHKWDPHWPTTGNLREGRLVL